jgi:hypothetical protein
VKKTQSAAPILLQDEGGNFFQLNLNGETDQIYNLTGQKKDKTGIILPVKKVGNSATSSNETNTSSSPNSPDD